MTKSSFPCPCCEFYTFSEPPPGTFFICPVCNWEDDPHQYVDIDLEKGANSVSLRVARINFKIHSCHDPLKWQNLRMPLPEEDPHHRFFTEKDHRNDA